MLVAMSRVGLVLGGGGVTGAAFGFGSLFGLEMATGWDANDADVVVGTSSGSLVGAVLRAGKLAVDTLVGAEDVDGELAGSLARALYRRTRPTGWLRWVRHGLAPGLRSPGIQLTVGSPALYSTDGVTEWLEQLIGPMARGWPGRPTIVVAYEMEARRRVAFGTVESPDVPLATAVAASSAVPMVFAPVAINGRHYVDGGVASGTSADLVLGAESPLDLVVIVAPMASLDTRPGSRFYEGVVDRLGASALDREIRQITAAWPETEILVLRPDPAILAETRPNPLSAEAAIPAFLATLASMRSRLAAPEIWPILERHLLVPGHR